MAKKNHSSEEEKLAYLKMQAGVGITKHMGGQKPRRISQIFKNIDKKP